MTDRTRVEAAYREGQQAEPGASNPYYGMPVCARMWREGYRDTHTRQVVSDDAV